MAKNRAELIRLKLIPVVDEVSKRPPPPRRVRTTVIVKKRALPMRSARLSPSAASACARASLSSDESEISSPRAQRPYRVAATRAMQLPTLSADQRSACEMQYGAVWRAEMASLVPPADDESRESIILPGASKMMEAFLSDADLQAEFCPRSRGACSPANKRQVLGQLALLASGSGIEHRAVLGAFFMKGEPLTLAHDASELAARADAWLKATAEDKGNGWLVGHPIGKFAGFQRYILSLVEPHSE